MSQKVTQKLVNQKCELLKSQNEDITVNKVRKLIGGNISIIDLVEKVTLYKQDKKKAFTEAEIEEQPLQDKPRDQLLNITQKILKEYSIEENQIAFGLRSGLKKYIDQQVSEKSKKLKQKQVEISNKNDSLEISNLTLNRLYNELLEKYNELKEESYSLKQNYNSKSMRFIEKETVEKTLLAWEDFKDIKEQMSSLGAYAKTAIYDKRGVVVIKFPATDFLTQECRSGVSRYLKAKTTFDYSIQAWILSGFTDILKTLDFLKRNKFIFSKELETIAYHRRKGLD
ncbi:hypothetical protein fh0823_14830 [Francisella halioticida]|uniref:Uncharacterized protein n=1 Tax=Francisella halioticida TaxID=549298 RepID=A0ABN5B096_9GAMM|nr:hypothetical protein [Francisella halioticida]ASG68462.1 hypothetical protein CDV26_08700 [Francisella halioticida]BCD91344.1 hypothetical protein fh0823_14830 [Francisella halioticida]